MDACESVGLMNLPPPEPFVRMEAYRYAKRPIVSSPYGAERLSRRASDIATDHSAEPLPPARLDLTLA